MNMLLTEFEQNGSGLVYLHKWIYVYYGIGNEKQHNYYTRECLKKNTSYEFAPTHSFPGFSRI